jgi:hypothetical protein
MPATEPIRPIAIYLPQFHPIPENDKAWGKGFTEWTNVTKAQPLFEGHYQPQLPADLGFYDLRVPETRMQQAELAKEYGIYGFCYYHYWFNGKRLLERPFKEVFESKQPNFPFMLCWANENWSRIWEGKANDVIIQQNYSEEDDLAHIRELIPYFKDKRYITVNNKPVIAIYNSTNLPNAKKTLDIWRVEALKEGLELYICRFESLSFYGKELVEDGGFDAAIDFHPTGHIINKFKADIIVEKLTRIDRKIKHKFFKGIRNKFPALYKKYHAGIYNRINYAEFVEYAAALPFPDYKWYPCATPGWDNSSRKGKNGFLFYNSTPQLFQKWLTSIFKKFKPYSKEENLMFINAWNEWAEGNHLEPCRKWGHGNLEALKKSLETANTTK